jgi:hypothetical protein
MVKKKKENEIFEGEEIRGVHLQLFHDYLSTIAPSGMEFERAFSAAKQICTKIRSSLNENAADCLRFLSACCIRTGSENA